VVIAVAKKKLFTEFRYFPSSHGNRNVDKQAIGQCRCHVSDEREDETVSSSGERDVLGIENISYWLEKGIAMSVVALCDLLFGLELIE